MKKYFVIFLLTIFSVTSFAQLKKYKEVYSKEYFETHKHYAHGKMKKYNYADKTWTPVGLDVLVIYNTFFKNYSVYYLDSKGAEQEMIFENNSSGKENYLVYNNLKWKADSSLEDYFSLFSGYIIFASPYDADIKDYKYQYDITFNMD